MGMTCQEYQAAAEKPWHIFRSDCPSCNARAISRSPHFAESRRTRRQTAAYRAALEAAGVTHEQVIEAGRVDKLR